MYAFVKLEDIGQGAAPVVDGRRQIPSRAWVARVIMQGDRIMHREFLKPWVDYTKANSKCTRGVMRLYFLEYGYKYEISKPISWKNTQRYVIEL